MFCYLPWPTNVLAAIALLFDTPLILVLGFFWSAGPTVEGFARFVIVDFFIESITLFVPIVVLAFNYGESKLVPIFLALSAIVLLGYPVWFVIQNAWQVALILFSLGQAMLANFFAMRHERIHGDSFAPILIGIIIWCAAYFISVGVYAE